MEERNEVPMIPKHQHQAEMMHMSRATRNMMVICVAFCFAFVLAIYIFVTGYTARTKDWLQTINNLQTKIVEVNNGQKKP